MESHPRPSERPRGQELEPNRRAGPLEGLVVVELGHFIAAPFATRLLADLGATVIKVEPPKNGDPARGWGVAIDGHSIWWQVHARNKKCITLDLRSPAGRDIAIGLIAKVDAVVENFRPGQLERWGLGPDKIAKVNPDCIVVRISGYGQYGPYRDKAAFGVIGEAIGGIRHLTGHPRGLTDLPPVRTGVSLADTVAAIYAALGLMSAIYERDRSRPKHARVVDIALYESVFSLLDGCLPEFGKLGVVREPSGSTISSVSPSNAYRCADGRWICIAGNSDRIFVRLMEAIGKPSNAADPRFTTNRDRVAHTQELDRMIGDWTATLKAEDALAVLDDYEVPSSLIYSIKDCANDPHFWARNAIQEVPDPLFGSILHPGLVPQFDGKPAAIGWPGPGLGAHTEEVLRVLLGLTPERITELRSAGVI